MNVKIGDTVIVDGKTSTVETQWNQMTDKIYKLVDGRLIHNLDKLIVEKKASVIVSEIPKKPWLR